MAFSRETGSKITVLLLSLSSLFFNLGANIQNLFELSKFYNLKVEITVIKSPIPQTAFIQRNTAISSKVTKKTIIPN